MAFAHGLKGKKMTRPESVFGDYYSAMETVCEGCTRETGWLEDWENHDTPDCAIRIITNDDMIEWDGEKWKCRERDQIERAELSLYERRMAGDWS